MFTRSPQEQVARFGKAAQQHRLRPGQRHWLLLVLATWASAPASSAQPASCPVAEQITIARDTELDPACAYRSTLRIVAGNLLLDCRGALIDATGRTFGILIGDRHEVSQVTVRNCRIRGGGNGIFVGRTESDALKAERYDRETLYRISPHHITLQGISVADTTRVGIYLDDYVSHVRIVASSVNGAASSGIYLEHSSRSNEIIDSTITGNGYGKFPNYRFGVSRREGISIDSSAYNLVQGNRIANNAAGGIFLYKNCQEHAHAKADSVPRWQHASHNVIRANLIEDEKVGVWLASRQSRDLSSWDCGDAPYQGSSHYLDYAHHNLVSDNRFTRVATGVRIEDDDNTVSGNTFVDNDTGIELGARRREEVLGKPLQGVKLRDNVFRKSGAEP